MKTIVWPLSGQNSNIQEALSRKIMRDVLSEQRYEGFVAVHFYSHVWFRGFDQFFYASDHLFRD